MIMSDMEKLTLLEETLELDEGTLDASQVLSDMDNFGSMEKLSLIVLFEDEFGKVITGDDVDKFATIQDILDAIDE
ncbi:MAG: acyl carrier protein [Lachnospiraceae bacterium]|nr:acyl carrier protein [Lachnospiraceae bacterium]